MAEDDPFTKIYDKLWSMMEARAEIVGFVAEGNRIKFNYDQKRSPLKERVSTRDLPELMLTFTGGDCQLPATSSDSRVTCTYQWIVSTGDLRLTKYMLPITFAMIRVMADWWTQLTSLTWNSNSFVKRATLGSGAVGQSNSELNRGIEGWTSIWTVTLELSFTTSDLIAP